MNREMLDKINWLLEQQKNLDGLLNSLKEAENDIENDIDDARFYEILLRVERYSGTGEHWHPVIIDYEYLKPAIVEYKNVLKTKLKELGYEEDQ